MTKSITDIPGVFASGGKAGIKADKLDLAYIFVPEACACAGVFTKNLFRAPCVEFTEHQVSTGDVKAVIINSGNANAATGAQGYAAARRTAVAAATVLGISESEVCVASTGIIGVALPVEKIEKALPEMLSNPEKREGSLMAQAICTTDTFPKEVFASKTINGKTFHCAGTAKGSGMIAPNMATMLGFVVLNAAISNGLLKSLLTSAVNDSFNMVSVDTDTSTNDLVLAFATGDVTVDWQNPEETALVSGLLHEVCTELAKLIARDGEGAEKLIEVRVRGARTKEEARQVAKNIINSPLVKTAIHGGDPNWGRVVMAAGKDPELGVDPGLFDLYFGAEQVLSKGRILDYNLAEVEAAISGAEVVILVHLNLGEESALAWGCDLTKGYIDINTDYN
jgi:glutamate N-acetyltransferase/amino-acid N-acetyltransferase